MNLKALIALIVAAAVAIAITATLVKKDSATWQTTEVGGLLFENLPVNDVETIHITQEAKASPQQTGGHSSSGTIQLPIISGYWPAQY